NAEPDIDVIGEAPNGREALRLAEELRPDLVLMDISMPEMNGIEATAKVKEACPLARVLILTMHENEEYLFRTIQAGGSGYVLKKSADTELVAAIHEVMARDTFLRPAAAQMLVADYVERVKRGEEQDSYNLLTAREKELLGLIASGLTNQQIAEQLVISIRTVETHRAHIMEKLQINTRAELVRYAVRKGLL
ncbi:MAG: response regulator transcription factor, partial [Nevskia sp.]|nr:response regulator transcription factor [Nevskia sp.]